MKSKYNPKDFEQRIYKEWLDSKAFYADENSDKPTFSIVMPPPNITGRLHIGHALNHTMQDIMTRFKRMQGFETLWLPGTDHASIATEMLVVRMLKEKYGISKLDLTREEFLKHAWEWKEKYGGEIVEQMKLLGDSADWSKERFTMDQGCSDAVKRSFVELYEKGYIYRGKRMITWCPSCKTTISDAEIDHEERDSFIYTIRYPLADGTGELLVATTRPETMFGDIAVAVHPDDDRYKHMVGKMLLNPVNNREIPIITAEEIEIEFGTGALKITPAHSEVDYEIGLRNNLEAIDSMNPDGTMNHYAGKYEGMDRYKVKELVVQELKEKGFLVKTEPHRNVVGRCDRCKTDVEPKISDQWFVKMEELAKPALEACKTGKLKFHTDNYSKLYVNWLEKIRDWNISRQLWWGHQIPAYYCEDCGEVMVSIDQPETCPACSSTKIRQETDVLDTWFSSALWPFSTMGWPDKTKLYDKFYPTNVLITSYDIIPLWVVRMVFQGLEQTGELPFTDVVINGLVRDKYGKKMSKSSGNGVDPLDIIDRYGADALRFGLMHGNSIGADIRMHEDKVEYARNFANKLWNASRFLFMTLVGDKVEDEHAAALAMEAISALQEPSYEELSHADRWILSRTDQIIGEVTALLDKYDMQFAASKLYDFIWSEYCDWYIELSKKGLYSDDKKVKNTVQYVLVTVLKNILKLMHPFMPYITEEIWSNFGNFGEGMLIKSSWAEGEKIRKILDFTEEKAAHDIGEMTLIMDAIRGIRNVRAEMNIPNSRKAVCHVEKHSSDDGEATLFVENKDYIISLANCSDVVYAEEGQMTDSALVNVAGYKLYLPFAELIDFDVELKRLEKEIETLKKEVERIEKKLANQGFVSKAPKQIVEEEKKKLEEYKSSLQAVTESHSSLLEKMK